MGKNFFSEGTAEIFTQRQYTITALLVSASIIYSFSHYFSDECVYIREGTQMRDEDLVLNLFTVLSWCVLLLLIS